MKARNEMDPRFMWDFTQLYETEEKRQEVFSQAEKDIEDLDRMIPAMTESKEGFKACLDSMYAVMETVERLYIYAMLRFSADASDSLNQALNAQAMNLYVKLSERMSLISTKLIAMEDDTVKAFTQGEDMQVYLHVIEDTRRAKEHTLSEEMEVFLAKLSDFAQTPDNTYSMFTDSDLVFPDTLGEDGEKAPLTNGNFSTYRESQSREVRKTAFETYFGTYEKFINTFGVTYSSLVKYDNLIAETKHYGSALEMALFANNIPVSVYQNLVKSVHDNLPAMRRYLDLRKRVLDLPDADMFDLYVPMLQDVKMTVPFADAKTLVKDALRPLGEEYQELLERAFNENWMDVYENKGKRSGAFSCGVYGVHPFVLLNYTDMLDDAYTVAHELGHSMHSYFSDTTQEFVNHDYAIFIAEVASTVNEVLLTLYLLEREQEPRMRAYILNKFAEGFRTTVYRQTLFAEFEAIAHEKAQNGEALTAEVLSGIYYGLISEYYDGIGIPEIMKNEWSYIPHFYTSFYVYQYATGFSSAVAIANAIKKTGDASGYLKFLSLGSSVYPIDALKVAGVDLTRPETVDDALRVFGETVDELAELL